MFNIIAGLLGGAMTASATRRAAKDQANALEKQRDITEKYANQAMTAQQDAARGAAQAQRLGANQSYDALFRGANRSADAGVAGYNNAANVIQGGLDNMWSNYQPSVDLGKWGVGQIKDHLSGNSNYEGSAAYKFMQREMSDALQAAQAKSGQLFSGATGTALQDRTRQMAALDEQQYFNNLYNSTALGQNALNAATGFDMSGRGSIANMRVGAGNVNAQRHANIGNAQADRASTIAGANAQKHLNIGNAAANAANVIGGVSGATAAQMGDVMAAGRIGTANAVSGAMDNVLSAYQYNQMMNQYPNYYGTQTSASGAPTTSPVPWASPFQVA